MQGRNEIPSFALMRHVLEINFTHCNGVGEVVMLFDNAS